MNNYQLIPIDDTFQVVLLAEQKKTLFSEEIERKVKEIWLAEKRISHRELYNGKMLSMVHLKKDRLIGQWVEYKYVLAQLRSAELRSSLQISPVAISGITYSDKKYLVGQRSDSVTQYPLFYELVPSGGISFSADEGGSLDYCKQAALELKEETGIDREKIVSIKPFALAQNRHSLLVDLCLEIQLKPQTEMEIPLKKEYCQVFWLSKNELKSMMKVCPEEWVPLSLTLCYFYLR